MRWISLFLHAGAAWCSNFVSVDEFLAWEVINSDSAVGTNDEPEVFGGEEDDVNWGFGIDFFEMLSFKEVPDVDMSISGSGSNNVGVWSKIKSVDLGLVSDEGVHQAHDGVVPNLDALIPRGRDDDWGLHILEVSNAGDPVGMWVLVNGKFADTLDVPKLDGLVHGAGGNLSIIW